MEGEQARKLEGFGSGKALTVVIVVVLMLSVLAFCLVFQKSWFGSGPGNESWSVLDIPGAREWVAECENKNPYIKENCIDLFCYEYAMNNRNETVCGFINDKDIRRQCRIYFKTIM